jgi:type II secretory ATPase GspE/PulE/Tfp pilus assembly ATPase PilB-like protein/pSer/pThr/pTyr-binding forkhead associated (FHA) protein
MDGPLLEIDQAGKRRYLKLTNAPVTIGRHPTNLLVITDDQASRFHCVIELSSDGGAVLRDLKSKNGTKLNGFRVDESSMGPGDEVRIGETAIRLIIPTGNSGAVRPVEQAPSRSTREQQAEPTMPLPSNVPSNVPSTTPPRSAQQQPQRPATSGLPASSTQPPQQRDQPPAKPAAAASANKPNDDDPLPMFEANSPRFEPKRMGAQLVRSDPSTPSGNFPPAPGSPASGTPGNQPLPGRSPQAARDLAAGKKPGPAVGKQAPLNVAMDHMRVLRDVAANLPDKTVDEAAIALLNTRNQTLHPAGVDPNDGDLLNTEVLRTLRLIFVVCFRIHGSDIHFEAKQEETQVRMRVDGMMVEICRMHPSVAGRLNNLIKILCDIEITGRATIQEGHFSAKLPNRRIDFRVSFTPAVNGQKLVIRVLDMGWAPQHMENLDLPPWMFETIRNIIRQDAGMILVCGPTGSGKTTSLYSCIRDIDVAQRNVVTIEDPVEYQIEGVTQIPINAEQGNTFSSVLRSVLRQDPDVILLGEIRDSDTAKIAMQASMTGHMVMSTVHAKDTLGTVFRLLDLGIEPYLMASALNVVLAQRLVRVLCNKCKTQAKPTTSQQMKMGRAMQGIDSVYIPEGCKACLQTGYHGRRAIFEMLHVNDEIRDVILKSCTMQDIRKALRNTVFVSLAECGYRMVLEGSTSFDEIERVVGSEQ